MVLGSVALLACGDDAVRMLADALADVPAEASAADAVVSDGDSTDPNAMPPRALLQATCEATEPRVQIAFQDGEQASTTTTTTYLARFHPAANTEQVISTSVCGPVYEYRGSATPPNGCPSGHGATTYECSGPVPFLGDCQTGTARWDALDEIVVWCGQITEVDFENPDIPDFASGTHFTTATLVVE